MKGISKKQVKRANEIVDSLLKYEKEKMKTELKDEKEKMETKYFTIPKLTLKTEEVIKERGKKYGEFYDNAATTQALMGVIKKSPNFKDLSDQHLESIHMIFHKISRMVCGDMNHIDNPVDIAGYANRLEECIRREKLTKTREGNE